MNEGIKQENKNKKWIGVAEVKVANNKRADKWKLQWRGSKQGNWRQHINTKGNN